MGSGRQERGARNRLEPEATGLDAFWLTHGKLITPQGIIDGAVRIARGRIAAIRSSVPRSARTISARGGYVAPGFIDLHVWGSPATISREAVKGGTTAFLSALGPDAPEVLLQQLRTLHVQRVTLNGAECLGVHLEGPFLNPARAGALPKRWMRRPTLHELSALARNGRVRLMTIAPELPGAASAIRWCARNRIAVSLGHSDADATVALRTVDAGATGVTHVFNGMRPFHHRNSALVDVALTDPRLVTMVILDGVHVSPSAFRLLVRAKGAERIALVTDSIRFQGCDVVKRHGAYYTRRGVLAGSALAMIEAVRNAVQLGGVPIKDAVRMASEVPARLIGERSRGTLAVGQRADLVVFDQGFRVHFTFISGKLVYHR